MIDPSNIQWDEPSALVGSPANGFKYSPAQMAQLNAARDALRAAEARGESYTYNAIDPANIQWDAPAKAAPTPQAAGPSAIPQEVPMIALGHTFDRLAAGLKQGARGVFGDSAVNAVDALGRKLGMADSSNLEQSQAGNEAEYAKLREANPAGTFIGDMMGAALAGPTPAGMAALGALEYGSPEERAMRAGTAYLGGKAGEAVAGKLASVIAGKSSANPIRDATVREAQQAGYVIPPSQINPESPGLVNRLSEGFAGKLQTAQLAAVKNQQVTNRLAAEALGLEGGTPITPQLLNNIRNDAGKAYAAVAKVGTLQVDNEFGAELGNAIGPYLQLKGEFPNSQSNAAIDALIKDVSKPTMESGAVVDLVRKLRFDGFRNIKAQDPATSQLGKVQIAAQDALENMVERNLAKTGDTSLLNAYQQARVLIAKTHTVENALEESTGKVVAGKIGREFSKGRPLTGPLAMIGKMAEGFPKAVQNVNTSIPGLSPLDYGSGVLGGVISGNPMVAAIPLARPVMRAGLLSAPYQRAVVGSSAGILPDLSASSAALLRDLMQKGGGLLGGTYGLGAL